jgi:hypothetical protein
LLQGFDYAIKAGYVRHLQLLRIVPVVSAVPIVPVVAAPTYFLPRVSGQIKEGD